jgi:hypothetical protein
MQETETIRTESTRLLRELHVRSILDAPCCDFCWMKSVDLRDMSYVGGDIVEKLAANNNSAFADESRRCAVENFKASGSGFLGTTTFTRQDGNEDIVTGQWRPLNLSCLRSTLGSPSG